MFAASTKKMTKLDKNNELDVWCGHRLCPAFQIKNLY